MVCHVMKTNCDHEVSGGGYKGFWREGSMRVYEEKHVSFVVRIGIVNDRTSYCAKAESGQKDHQRA